MNILTAAIIISVTVWGGIYFLNRAIMKLCERIDRLATAWESDDDDDSDSWKKDKV